MSKANPTYTVYYWPTKRKGTDVWKVVINDPGGGPTIELKERYKRAYSAKRGGIRKVKRMNPKATVYTWAGKPVKP